MILSIGCKNVTGCQRCLGASNHRVPESPYQLSFCKRLTLISLIYNFRFPARSRQYPLVERITLASKDARFANTRRFDTGDCGLIRDSAIALGTVPPKRIAKTGRTTGAQQQQAFVESVTRKAPAKEDPTPL